MYCRVVTKVITRQKMKVKFIKIKSLVLLKVCIIVQATVMKIGLP